MATLSTGICGLQKKKYSITKQMFFIVVYSTSKFWVGSTQRTNYISYRDYITGFVSKKALHYLYKNIPSKDYDLWKEVCVSSLAGFRTSFGNN